MVEGYKFMVIGCMLLVVLQLTMNDQRFMFSDSFIPYPISECRQLILPIEELLHNFFRFPVNGK